jgi:hypothetical protein
MSFPDTINFFHTGSRIQIRILHQKRDTKLKLLFAYCLQYQEQGLMLVAQFNKDNKDYEGNVRKSHQKTCRIWDPKSGTISSSDWVLGSMG